MKSEMDFQPKTVPLLQAKMNDIHGSTFSIATTAIALALASQESILNFRWIDWLRKNFFRKSTEPNSANTSAASSRCPSANPSPYNSKSSSRRNSRDQYHIQIPDNSKVSWFPEFFGELTTWFRMRIDYQYQVRARVRVVALRHFQLRLLNIHLLICRKDLPEYLLLMKNLKLFYHIPNKWLILRLMWLITRIQSSDWLNFPRLRFHKIKSDIAN